MKRECCENCPVEQCKQVVWKELKSDDRKFSIFTTEERNPYGPILPHRNKGFVDLFYMKHIICSVTKKSGGEFETEHSDSGFDFWEAAKDFVPSVSDRHKCPYYVEHLMDWLDRNSSGD